MDLTGLEEGQTITVKWRGKPVFIKHRDDADIAAQAAVPLSDMIDPQTDAARVVDPKVREMIMRSRDEAERGAGRMGRVMGQDTQHEAGGQSAASSGCSNASSFRLGRCLQTTSHNSNTHQLREAHWATHTRVCACTASETGSLHL